MTKTRIKISSIIENQLPQFVLEEFPLASEFLKQYYVALENQGGTVDILQNIDQYIKVDNITNLIEYTNLKNDVTFFDSTITVQYDPNDPTKLGTYGFPDSYGLLLIGSEIITYTSKTLSTFEGCIRGFSGVSAYTDKKDELTFSDTEVQEHSSKTDGSPTKVINLSILFLKEFLHKVKKQVTPGFENRELYSGLDERLFIKQAIDFYSSKGTDNSFKILFGALYGQNVEVIKPRDYLIEPSNAQYRITSDLIVQPLKEGVDNPENLINSTLYQDKVFNIEKSQGTITRVEKIRRGSKTYYSISLDYDYDKDIQPKGTVYGNFSIHPKTKATSFIPTQSTTLEVDSTVGFPNQNGVLIVDLENETSLTIQYTSKTLTQFLGCSGVTQDIPKSTDIKLDSYAYGYIGIGTDNPVRLKILGVISKLNLQKDNKFYSEGDTIKIKTLGIDSNDYKSNNWFLNIPVKYKVKSIRLLDLYNKSYEIEVYDDHLYKVRDTITITSSAGFSKEVRVQSISNEKTFSIKLGPNQIELDTNLSYNVERKISKASFQNFSSANQYTTNVQNIYLDDEKSLYVASPSLPSYLNESLPTINRSVEIPNPSGNLIAFYPDDTEDLTKGTTVDLVNKHGFYTGDSVVYKSPEGNPLGIQTGIYFVKVINETKIKLARSKNNIFEVLPDRPGNFVSLNGSVTSFKLELTEFTYRDLTTQQLDSQKLIRKISTPEIDGNVYETKPGFTGIFVNGVELLNYKSKDDVYYGPIKKIIPSSPGSGYDIINPPILSVSDPIGSGCSAYCSVIGGLERIDIIDPGFDYLETPSINITGGNGFGAVAEANLISFDHEVLFNSQSSAGLVKLNPTNTIGFSSHHKFRDAEEVIYLTDGQNSVSGLSTVSLSGLSTNSSYFVSVQDAFTVKLHRSFSDAVSGINTIQLISYGNGIHKFKSKNKKKKIGSISVKSSGNNYQNKLTSTTSSGISTQSDTIQITNHGYNSGEIIVYNATESVIGGLTSSTSYYVTKISDDQFKLSNIGVSTLGISSSFYFDTKQYINLTSSGSGIHRFNYEPIKVSVKGRVGISTRSGQNFSASVTPVFRGKIQSVFVESGGTSYGCEDIINYNRQPLFELNSGSGIQLTPIISDGKLVKVIVNSSGSGYNSPPDINVIGDGSGAVLSPIFSNGTLVKVNVISSGGGYTKEKTSIIVTTSGIGAKFEAQIQSWKINLVERLLNTSKIESDDGILSSGLDSNYGIQYSHAYAPRYLRRSVQGSIIEDGIKKYKDDLILSNNGEELPSQSHSPIIGWAYDGNPIYGPYGFSSKTGSGGIKPLASGYKKILNENRPRYAEGFFVEDYSYVGDGDLDEHNGRFCVTPEYPNGIYAYFATISETRSSSDSGVFSKYNAPTFPYVIGQTYNSKPIDFNFKASSNQDDIDINQTNWLRNTTPYNILNDVDSYDCLFNSNTVKEQNSIVKKVSTSIINSIGIETGGQNYKIDDKIFFKNNLETSVGGKVSLIKGKTVNKISVSSSIFDDVEIEPYNQQFIGFTTVPHNFLNNDLVTFVGKYDYKKSGNISVSSNTLTLTSGIGSAQYTGLVTYFNVSGNLNYPNIKENDIYEIGTEQIKVLNIDPQSSRIKVVRNQNNTTGIVSYSAGIGLTEKTRKFGVNFGISTSYNFNINRQFYFDPKESVGLGTTSGVGIVSTIYFSNPGVGITQITIPTQTIYLPNHNLITGDILIYSSNGGTRVSVSTDGVSSFQLGEKSSVYVAKISNDLIGISTIKVGLGSTGSFVGLGSTSGSILYFTSVGTGNTHSFKTNYENILNGQISKNVVTVSTAETHGLSLLDKVRINIKSGISTTFEIKYNDFNRRMVINPKSFSSIDTTNNIININNHQFYDGQKVIYTAVTPAGGLSNNQIYYVIVIDPNKIKLSNSYYGATKEFPEVVDITSSSSGVISSINPPIKVIKNQSIIFDLSDSSLSFTNSGIGYSAFDFRLYKDSNFIEEFNSTQSTTRFEVTKTGQIGVDSTAKVSLVINDKTPINLYYKLVPVNLSLNQQIKKEVINDTEVIGANKVSIIESQYNGNQSIVGISSTSFIFNILNIPEVSQYTDGIEYYTNSKSTYGEIKEILLKNKVKKYQSLPEVESISSELGSGAILKINSDSIGKIETTELLDIGFDYSVDRTVRPTVNLPIILSVDVLSSLDYVGIVSFGRNYNIIPNLVVIDGLTNKVIDDIELTYKFGDSNATIIKNNNTLNNVTPKIIPTNNTNGIKIKNIVFNSTTKDVVVTLGASFSDPKDFPFVLGGKVLIEGVSVGLGTTGKGYNSSNYNYSLFTLTGITSALGGVGVATVVYNLGSYLKNSEFPGTFNSFYSSGKIIPESQFPIFNPVLKKNIFYKGENVFSSSSKGTVESWNPINQYLKVSTIDNFSINSSIIGETSGTAAIIKDITSFSGDYIIDSSSKVRKGWNTETGFLNNDFQRMHDSDYYQYFSYSLKSQIDFNTWDNPVSSLNHTSGFKKFSDLNIISKQSNIGINTSQDNGDFVGITDFSSFVDLNCVQDFDLARENSLQLDRKIKSDQVFFESRIIQDYIESIGNRVLLIDDISNQFNSNPRPTQFSIVDSFLLSDFRSKKYFASIKDKDSNFIKNQTNLISLIYKNNLGFLNQYGLTSSTDLGFFDFSVYGNQGNLLFYPVSSKYNDYHIELFSFSLSDSTSGIGTLSLGNVALIGTGTTTIPQGTSASTPIVGIASTYRSSKVLVQIGSVNSSYYQYNEITYVHNGSEVYLLDYGEIATSSLSTLSGSGIGTFNGYISGSKVYIDLVPNSATTIDYVVNTVNVSLANTNATGIGTQILGGSSINSSSVAISSSPTPTANVIASYSNEIYDSSYVLVSIEDKTNSDYQVSEILTITNSEDSYITEFGMVQTDSSLGVTTIGKSGTVTNIYFTPLENIDIDVKTIQINLSLSEESSEISLNNGTLTFDYGSYTGSYNDIKKSFELKNNNLPIFNRYFSAQDSSVVNVPSNLIKIPDHFFVTGEEITYSYNKSTSQPVGIATTTIPGIGSTDKLPSSLFIVKVDDKNVRVSASASEALKSIPNTLTITSVGIGSSHLFTAKNQNKKSLISIDNLIQSPLVSTAITTKLSNSITAFTSEIFVSGISSIYSGDLIKIDDEIMKVTSVGVGSTNAIAVFRPFLGTGISTHSQFSLVTKVSGNYNIIGNTIYFSEAPYGKIPSPNIINRPDEQEYSGISTGSSFNGRVFLRSSASDTVDEVYSKNYIFDSISYQFDSMQDTFTLKSNQSNVTGISSENAILLINGIFQSPNGINFSGNYTLSESSGITSVSFTGVGKSVNYDVNTASIPRGGIIVSVGSSQGFGYQPLVSAGGTAVVSVAGTIQSISIGNSGSGYRAGIQTVVNVGVYTGSSGIPNIQFIGIASISKGNVVSVAITNPGTGYTSTNPPLVIFDSPLSYSNVPLVYSSQSSSGNGSGSTVDIVVGQGSSVISFELKNLGYAYKKGEILTVSIGGTTGIPTNTTSPNFKEFQISIEETHQDSFSAWNVGSLEVLDSWDFLFDGNRKLFPILIDGIETTIKSKPGSKIEPKSLLLIFINDILQVPDQSYIFNGGSTVRFLEPPKNGDKSKILFYRGTEDVDTVFIDILETIKVGDKVTLKSDVRDFNEDERLVTDIISSDSVNTNLYDGPGISENEELVRPLTWCRQTEDLIINGQVVAKDRIIYEPYIQPSTNIIRSVGIASTEIFVESIKTFFDSEKEYVHNGLAEKPQNKIIIVSQDEISVAIATAVVSTSGTISSITLIDGGVGYGTTPIVSIGNPVGIGTTLPIRATASATIINGSVNSIAIGTAGIGYTSSNPPIVLIESPQLKYEIINNISYSGDFGVITGIKTTSVGVASTGIIFDLYIPLNSPIRDKKTVTVGIATTGVSGIQTGYYFIVNKSNVGNGLTSLNSSNSVIGIGTTFIDNIYQVAAVSIAQTSVPGVGLTYVSKVTVSVSNYNGLSGLGFSNFYGEYSWGRISSTERIDPQDFTSYANVGGISTSPIVQRFNRLKYIGYSTS